MASDLTRGLVGGLNAGNNFLTYLLQDKLAQNRTEQANEYDVAKTLDQRTYDTEKTKQAFMDEIYKANLLSALEGKSDILQKNMLGVAPEGTNVMGKEVGAVSTGDIPLKSSINNKTYEEYNKGNVEFTPNEDYFKNKFSGRGSTIEIRTQEQADMINKATGGDYGIGDTISNTTSNILLRDKLGTISDTTKSKVRLSIQGLREKQKLNMKVMELGGYQYLDDETKKMVDDMNAEIDNFYSVDKKPKPVEKPVIIDTPPPANNPKREKAIQLLKKEGYPVTEDNIAKVVAKL